MKKTKNKTKLQGEQKTTKQKRHHSTKKLRFEEINAVRRCGGDVDGAWAMPKDVLEG